MTGFLDSLFRRRARSVASFHPRPSDGAGPDRQQELFRIDFDMMLKGSICKRRREVVRQFGVTVNGSTRLVTSGDMVDLDTYKALLAAAAIRPASPKDADALSAKSSFVDHTAIESPED